jgi:uracil-DNA glycosylase family 4
MTFIPMTNSRRLVPGVGRDSAKIAIVGDYTSGFDDKALRPFSGPAGSVIESCLHAAGLIKGEVYLTNCFKSKTQRAGKFANTDFFIEEGKNKGFTELGLEHAEMLRKELAGHKANVIVAAGKPALMALSRMSSVAKYRGYVCIADKLGGRKLIPTHSPNATMRGNYIQRQMIVADLRKAKIESDSPYIVRPERTLIWNHENVEEVLQWMEYFEKQDIVSFDIEVINYEVACISFSSDPSLSVVVPIGDSTGVPRPWTELEEVQIWRAIQRVLGNPKSEKVGQNLLFDTHFLATRNNIVVRGPIRDTMIGHSVMFPEMPKGLGFLGSLYCGSQEYWKDSVKFNNIKEES